MKAFKVLVLLIAIGAIVGGCGRTDQKNPKDKELKDPNSQVKVVLQPSASLLGEDGGDGLEIHLPVGDQTQVLVYKGRWDGGSEAVAFENPDNSSEKINVFVMGESLEVVIAVSYPSWDLSESNSGTAYVFVRNKDDQEKYTNNYKMTWLESETSAAYVIKLIEAYIEAEGVTAEQAVLDIAQSEERHKAE